MQNVKKNKENIFFGIIFIILICLGFLISKDYGATLDDQIYYRNGLATFNYVENIFSSIINNQFLNIDNKDFEGWPVIFEMLLVILTQILNITKIEDINLFAHKLNYIIFLISLFVFAKLVKIITKSSLYSILSIFLIILSPRIFAESFYNSRDIFFLSVFIFFSFSAYKFLENSNIKSVFLLSVFTAILFNTKILGIIPILIFISLYLFNLIDAKFKKHKLIYFSYFLILTNIFIYVTWPYLWGDYFNNMFKAFKDIIIAHDNMIIINYYFGDYISSATTPWHYRIIWFLISTPLSILPLFLFALINNTNKLVKKIFNAEVDNFKMSDALFFNIFYLLTFVFSFYLTCRFNQSQFGSWRHLYFLYPIVILFFLQSLEIIRQKINRRLFIIILSVISINLIYNLKWMIENHPYQYVYFNSISKNFAYKNFDLDYWGVSHFQALKYILENDDSEKIEVYFKGFTSPIPSLYMLNEKARSRIKVLDNISASNYIIDNKMKKIRGNVIINQDIYSKYFELMIDNVALNTIYKKK